MGSGSGWRRGVGTFLWAFSCAASAQQLPSPCGTIEPPRLELRDNFETPTPNQPVSLTSLFRLVPSTQRKPAYIGVCMRRTTLEKLTYDVSGVKWSRQPGSTFDFACVDIEGSLVNSSMANYGTNWSAASVIFTDKAREKVVPFVDWTIQYQWAGPDISYGAWACQDQLSAPEPVKVPVGFDPTLAMLNAQSLWPLSTENVSEASVITASDQLRRGFATKIVADETSAAVLVYRVGKFFNEPVTFRLESDGFPPGTLRSFDPGLLKSSDPGPGTSVTIQPDQFKTLPGNLGQESKYAFAVYRAPKPRFQPLANPTVTVTAVNYEDEHSIELPVVAPPVLLVHGLWGSLDTFSSWPGDSRYPSFTFKSIKYDGSKSFRDPGNQATLKAAIISLQDNMRAQGVVGSKVDIVSHSMGGLMARQLLASTENARPRGNAGLMLYNTSPVYRLITLDTPHTGSPLATLLWNIRASPMLTTCNVGQASKLGEVLACEATTTVGGTIERALGPIDSAVRDMGSSSFDATSLASPAEASGGHLTVSGSVTQADSLAIKLNAALQAFGQLATVSGIFGADGDSEHDVIVGRKSQERFKSSSAIQIAPYALNHTDITKDRQVRLDVLCYLGQGDCAQGVGLQKPRLRASQKALTGPEWDTNLSGMTRSSYAASPITLDFPLQQGMLGSFFITVPGRAIRSAYVDFGATLLDSEQVYQPQPNPGADWIRFSNLPVSASETMRATMIVLFSDNTYGVYKQSFSTALAPAMNYSGPRLVEDFFSLEVGGTAIVEVVGKGASDHMVSIPIQNYAMTVNSGADVIELTSTGQLRALKEGKATFSLSNADIGLSMVGNVIVGNPIEPVVAAPKISLAGVEFVNQAPTVTLLTRVGASVSGTVTVTNGGTADLQIGLVGFTAAAGVTLQSNACANVKLVPSASCLIAVRYAPSVAGSGEAILTINSSDPRYASLPIRWAVSSNINVGTASVDITGVTCSGVVGQATSCGGTAVVRATGGPIVLNSTPVTIGGTNSSEFKITAGTCANATLAADASCPLGTITFTPGAAGTRTAVLSSSVAQGVVASATLTGTGTTATGGAGGASGGGSAGSTSGGGGGGSFGLGSLALLLLLSMIRFAFVSSGDGVSSARMPTK